MLRRKLRSSASIQGEVPMASIRHHARINRSPDDVWALVADAGGLGEWFPGIESCTLNGDVRSIEMMGMEIDEKIVLSDDALRRLQYSIVAGPMVPEHHLCTMDVIEDGEGSLLVYSCDVSPDELGEVFDGVYKGATEAIKAELEK
jgi:hypothetical protein